MYVTAAEVFVVCAGLAIGLRSKHRWSTGGWRKLLPPLAKRAFVLYLWSVFLLIGIGALNKFSPGLGQPIFTAPHASWASLIFPSLSLNLAPPILDILPLYLNFLFLVPMLVLLLTRDGWGLIILISAVAWWLNWVEPYSLSWPPADRGGRTYFSLASWQILFVSGFLIAWFQKRLRAWWFWTPSYSWLIGLGIITAGLSWAAVQDSTLWAWPLESPERESWLAATDRSLLGPIRLIAVAAFLPLLLRGMQTIATTPSLIHLRRVLLTLGQQSLYAYVTHIPMVIFWTVLIAPHLKGRAWLASLGQLAAVFTLWWMAKHRIGFRHLPL